MKKADFIIFSGFLLIYPLSQINSFGQHTLWVYVCKPDRLNSVYGYMQANMPKPGITPTQISKYQQKYVFFLERFMKSVFLGKFMKRERERVQQIPLKSHVASFCLL